MQAHQWLAVIITKIDSTSCITHHWISFWTDDFCQGTNAPYACYWYKYHKLWMWTLHLLIDPSRLPENAIFCHQLTCKWDLLRIRDVTTSSCFLDWFFIVRPPHSLWINTCNGRVETLAQPQDFLSWHLAALCWLLELYSVSCFRGASTCPCLERCYVSRWYVDWWWTLTLQQG